MSDNYALDKQMERLFEKIDTQRNWLETIGQDVCAQADLIKALQQEVAELRGELRHQLVRIVAVEAKQIDTSNVFRSRLAALERPAAATPGPVCANCGHPKGMHSPEQEAIGDYCCIGDGTNCGCYAFTPAQPAPAEGIDVDRVMEEVRLYGEARHEYYTALSMLRHDPKRVDRYEDEWKQRFESIRAMLGGAR